MGCAGYLKHALGLGIAATAFLMLDLPRAQAAGSETRQFTVMVDGKKSGDYQLVVQPQVDGSVVVSAQSEVRVTLLGIAVYTYSYRARETWKDGRLQTFESSGKEKGKDFSVRAQKFDLKTGAVLRVQATDGKVRDTRPDLWTTSCWQLPPAQYRNNNVVLLGCDTGAEIQSRLQLVATEQIKVAGQTMTCTHYRVMKDVLHDVWYDAQERMVRDEWVSSGHKTVVEMTGMR
jgi:hypothetical protein